MCSCTGVYGGTIGGLESLKDYEKSTYTQKKEELIRKLASQVAVAFNINNPQSMKLQELHKLIKTKLPNPEKNMISGSKQVLLCEVLAKAMNSVFGTTVVSLNDSPESQCVAVCELLDSLFTGAHSEFITIAKDVRMRIAGLETLIRLLKDAKTRVDEIVRKSGDDNLVVEMRNSDLVMKEVFIEADRQLALLKNMLSISIAPVEKNVLLSMEKQKSLSGLLGKFKKMSGTQEFGQKLLYVLSGIDSLMFTVDAVDRALSDVGMSVKEYTNVKSMSELSDKLTKKLRLFKGKDAIELSKFINAIELLNSNYYRHDQIAQALTKRVSPKVKSKVGGDARLNMIDARMNTIKKNKNFLRSDFATKLNQYYGRLLAEIDYSIKKIGKSIPIDEHLEAFGRALDRLDRDPDLRDAVMVKALTGELNDAASRDRKNKFIKELTNIAKAAKSVKGMEAIASNVEMIAQVIEDFTNIFTQIKSVGIVKKPTVNTDEVEAFGAGEYDEDDKHSEEDKPGEDEPDNMYGEHSKDEPDNMYGEHIGSGERKHKKRKGKKVMKKSSKKYKGGDDYDERKAVETLSNSVVDLQKSFDKFRYAFRIAYLRDSLSRMSTEHDEYNKKYEDLLGNAVGKRVSVISKEMTDLIEKLNTKFKEKFPQPSPKQKEFLEGAVYQMTTIKNVRIKLIKTLEAIDLYLCAFADGIARNPDDIGDVLKMLDSLKVNMKWYTNKVGDDFVSLYDRFRSEGQQRIDSNGNLFNTLDPNRTANLSNDNNTPQTPYVSNLDVTANDLLDKSRKQNNNLHYWDIIRKVADPNSGGKSDYWGPGTGMSIDLNKGVSATSHKNINIYMHIGDVTTYRPVRKYKEDISKASSVLNNITALKNIVSVFVSIGQKFGGEDLLNKCPMSPSTIYKNLSEYLNISAYSPDAEAIRTLCNQGFDATHPRNWQENVFIHPFTVRRGMLLYTDYINKAKTVEEDLAKSDLDKFTNDIKVYCFDFPMVLNNAVDDHSSVAADAKFIAVPYGYDGNAFAYTLRKLRIRGNNDNMVSNESINAMNAFFSNEDDYFIMGLKSMVAKVLTAVGTYSMLNRSPFYKGDKLKDSPAGPYRQILGGSETVTVHKDCAELYIRLPLLVEFYRDIHMDSERSGSTSDAARKITIIPEFDNIFGSLITLIYVNSANVKSGSYSDNTVRDIITEVNKIYTYFKSQAPKDPNREALMSLVAEMNRRYGIYLQKQLDEWRKNNKGQAFMSERNGTRYDNSTNYEILPNEGELSYSRPNPSDRYSEMATVSTFSSDDVLSSNSMFQLLSEFRDNVSRALSFDGEEDKYGNKMYSFGDSIHQLKEKIELSTTGLDKYNAVRDVIHTTSKIGFMGNEKIMVLHELVISPLFALSMTLDNVQQYVDNAGKMQYGVVSSIVDYLNSNRGNVMDANKITRFLPRNNLKDQYLDNYAMNIGVVYIGDAANYEYINSFYVQPGEFITHFADAGGSPVLKDWSVSSRLVNSREYFATYRELIESVQYMGPHFEYKPYIQISSNMDFNMTLQSFIERIWHFISNNELVTVRGDGDDSIIVDCTSLMDNCEKLLQSIKLVIDKLRSSVDYLVISRIEKSLSMSVRDIDYKMDILFRNKYSTEFYQDDTPMFDVNDAQEFINGSMKVLCNDDFDYLNSGIYLSDMLSSLTKGDNSRFNKNDTGSLPVNIRNLLFEGVERVSWSDLISKQQFNSDSSKQSLLATPFTEDIDDNLYNGTSYLVRENWYDFSQLGSKGVVQCYNHIIAHYLDTLYDSGTSKVYEGSMGFVAGPIQRAIMNGQNLLDGVTPDVNLCDMSNLHPLSSKLSFIIKRITQEKIKGSEKKNMEKDISNISEFHKEKMRCNIPYLRESLKMLIERIKMIRMFSVSKLHAPIIIKKTDRNHFTPTKSMSIDYDYCHSGNYINSLGINSTYPINDNYIFPPQYSIPLNSRLYCAKDGPLGHDIFKNLPAESKIAIENICKIIIKYVEPNYINKFIYVLILCEFQHGLSIDYDLQEQEEGNTYKAKELPDTLVHNIDVRDFDLPYGENLSLIGLLEILSESRNLPYNACTINEGRIRKTPMGLYTPLVIQNNNGSFDDRAFDIDYSNDDDDKIIDNIVYSYSINSGNITVCDYLSRLGVCMSPADYVEKLIRGSDENIDSVVSLFYSTSEEIKKDRKKIKDYLKEIRTADKLSQLFNGMLFNREYVKTSDNISSEDNKKYVLSVLDDISSSCELILKSMDKTLKDIDDIPIHGEVYRNSIVDYKNNNRYYPIAPLSMLLIATKNLTTDTIIGFPFGAGSVPGTPMFKFNYANRGIYTSIPNINDLVTFKYLMDNYNSTDVSDSKLDEKLYIELIKTYLTISQYIIKSKIKINLGNSFNSNNDIYSLKADPIPEEIDDITLSDILVEDHVEMIVELLKRYDAMHNKELTFMHDNLIKTANTIDKYDKFVNRLSQDGIQNTFNKGVNQNITNINTLLDRFAPYSVLSNKYESPIVYTEVDKLVNLITNVDQKSEINEIASRIGMNSSKNVGNRESLRKLNIVDININPVNFHALRREIPLVNLMNYAYTFDKIVDSSIKAKDSFISNVLKKKNMLDGLDINDRTSDLSVSDITTKMQGFALGLSNDGFGRPRFISDQIWNKLLFRNMYKYDDVLEVSKPNQPKQIKKSSDNSGFKALLRMLDIIIEQKDKKLMDKIIDNVLLHINYYENSDGGCQLIDNTRNIRDIQNQPGYQYYQNNIHDLFRNGSGNKYKLPTELEYKVFSAFLTCVLSIANLNNACSMTNEKHLDPSHTETFITFIRVVMIFINLIGNPKFQQFASGLPNISDIGGNTDAFVFNIMKILYNAFKSEYLSYGQNLINVPNISLSLKENNNKDSNYRYPGTFYSYLSNDFYTNLNSGSKLFRYIIEKGGLVYNNNKFDIRGNDTKELIDGLMKDDRGTSLDYYNKTSILNKIFKYSGLIDTSFEFSTPVLPNQLRNGAPTEADHQVSSGISRHIEARVSCVLTQNMMRIISMHMLLRKEMKDEIEKIDSPVVSKIAALNTAVTEFNNAEQPIDEKYELTYNQI